MSILFNAISRLWAGLFDAHKPAQDLDSMSLHDWADLPPHHPIADRAPC